MASQSDLDIINSVIEREFQSGIDFDAFKLTDENLTYTVLTPLADDVLNGFNTTIQNEQPTFTSDKVDEIMVTQNNPEQARFYTTIQNEQPTFTSDIVDEIIFTQNNAEQANVNQGIDTFKTTVLNDQPTFTFNILDECTVTQNDTEQANVNQGVDNSLTHGLPNYIGDLLVTRNVPDDTEASDLMTPVSPKEVFGEAPKKRGRKRKSEESQPPSRRQRPKKPKAYERETPFDDEELERKRKNARNAKLHREKHKEILQELRNQLATVMKEKDALAAEVEKMRLREATVIQQLQFYQQSGTKPPVLIIESH